MDHAAEVVDVASVIENPKFNWYRVSIIAWACAIISIEGYNMLVLGYAAPSIIKAWHVSKVYFGTVFGVGLFGYMLGATMLGHLGDRYGRKKAIIAASFFFGVFTLASGFATSINMLMAIRFIAGIGLGVSIPTTIALAAEYAPTRSRATMIGIMFIGYNVGGALGGVIAAKYIPLFGWPVIFYVGGIAPILLAVALIFMLPESVRFLALKQDQPEKVAAILTRIAPERHFAPDAQYVLYEENRAGIPVSQLFTEGRARVTSLLWLAFVMSLIGHYFLTSWLPTVLASEGVSLSHSVLAGALFQFGGAVGSVLVCWFMDRRGIMAIAAAFAIATPLTILLGVVGAADTLLMTLAFLNGICMLGGQVGLNAMSGTIYPTYIRSTGAGWAFGVGRIGSIVGPVLGGMLINLNPSNTMLFTVAAIPVACCAGAAFLLGKAPAAQRTNEAAATAGV